VDIKYSLNEDGSIIDENVFTGEFDEAKFEETLHCMLSIRGMSYLYYFISLQLN